MQRRRITLLESIVNTSAGFVVSVLVGIVVFPLFGYPFRVVSVTGITAVYTVLSVVRCYVVRRIFVNLFKDVK